MAELLVQNGKSIEAIQEIAKDGDIVYVESGQDYDEVISLWKAGITYISLEKGKAKTGQWFYETGAHRIKVLDFEVTTGNLRGGFILNRGNKNNLIKGCHMFECGDIGVDVTAGSDYNIIEDSLIHDCHYAFHTSASGGSCIGNIFRRNHCYNHSDGINVSPSALGTKLIENVIHDCEDDGIHCFDNGRPEIIGNLIYLCKGVPFWVNGTQGGIERNNTIIGLMPSPKDSVKKIVVWLEWGSHDYKNNIAYVDHPDMKLLQIDGSGILDYNCWHNPQNPLNRLEYNNVVGLHSILKDPRFVDILKNDYRLKPDSPCIGTGENEVNMGYWQNGGDNGMWDITGIKIVLVEEKGSISGTVVNEADEPLAGVDVEASGPVVVTSQSASDGTFVLSSLPTGIYAVKGIKTGYKCDAQNITIGA